MEERSQRESSTEKMAEMEDQLATQREALEKAISERDTNSHAVDGLQRALQEIQNGALDATPYKIDYANLL